MDIISSENRKAIKTHTCCWCGGKIIKGETYHYSFLKDDNVYIWKNHLRGGEIVSYLDMFSHCDNGVTEDAFVETIREEYMKIMSNNHNEIYESKDFKYPTFLEQLEFVCDFHKVIVKTNSKTFTSH